MSDMAPMIVPVDQPPLWRQRFITDTGYLERCVRRFFCARDIMEPLRVFDERQDAGEVRGVLEAQGLPVAGIAREGRIFGCCASKDLGTGPCGSFAVPVSPELEVEEERPLLEVIERLGERHFVLVLGAAGISGFVAHADLQKPPVRMLLFAVVSIVELRWQGWIHEFFGGSEAWQACITAARLELARGLMEERNRNGWKLELVDCLQFSDRASIIMKTPELWKRTLFTSRNEARERIRAVQRLRDDLAHSQDLLVENWETILGIARWLNPACARLRAASEPVRPVPDRPPS